MNTVNLNNFSVSVEGGRHKYMNNSHYFFLRHQQEYAIILHNGHDVRCDADITIDGEKVGTFRVKGHSRVRISRPVNVDRKFVFLCENLSEAYGLGSPFKEANGLVTVTFRPEKPAIVPIRWNQTFSLSDSEFSPINKAQSAAYSNGFTALGESSGQCFNATEQIHDVDQANVTTIHVRLVVGEVQPRYISIGEGIHGFQTDRPPRISDRWFESYGTFH